MIAVLLAAGHGRRLQPITSQELAKGLVPIAGKPLVHHTIDFAKAVGASRIVVVGGFLFDMMRESVSAYDPAITVVKNELDTPGNISTLLAALPHVDEDFLLCNIDHIYKKPLAEEIIPSFFGGEHVIAYCDTDRALGADDMKVLATADNTVDLISKTLPTFTHGYVGLTYCPASALKMHKDVAQTVYTSLGESGAVEHVLQALASNHDPVHIADISGIGWLEIDTAQEHESAQARIFADPNEWLRK